MDTQHIARLIVKHLRHELTEQESHDLNAWRAERKGNEDLYKSLTDPNTLHERLQEYSLQTESEMAADWQRLVEMGLPPQPNRSTAIKRSFLRYAAMAAAIALGTVITILLWPPKGQKLPVAQKEQTPPALLPGGNRATLTLGNGQTISLDDAKLGQISRQDATDITKQDSGHLVYDVKDQLAHVSLNTITTPRGGQYKVTLPDGSRIWLNSASSVRFPTAFTGNERRVHITGEAYFEVVHNTQKPFVVVAGASTVQVLGTTFNINSYSDEPAIRTTLLTGSIQLRADDNAQQLKLAPGQQATIPNVEHARVTVKRLSDPLSVVGWKEGYFTFDRDSLPAIMRQLARWFDLKVVYSGPPPPIEFSGKLPRNTSARNILPVLKSMGVSYSVEGNTITIIDQQK